MPESALSAIGHDDRIHQNFKVPPHSIEAEQAVIGGLMIKNDAWDEVADKVREDDFFRKDHTLIFRAIGGLAREDKPFDVVTLSERLETLGELEQAGGMLYLGNLANETPSAANIKAYADIVRNKSVLRQLIDVGDDIAQSAYDPGERSVKDILDHAETQVFKIAESGGDGAQSYRAVNDLLAGAVDRIQELYENGDDITGLPSGFTDFDKMTSGLQPTDLVIIAARPSMGKTTFAVNIAENVALAKRLPVAIFSMEMAGEQLAMRMISSLGRINQQRLRTGKLEASDWPRVTSAISLLSETKIFIDDTPSLSPTDLRAKARRIKRDHGLALIVIDYLQLMQVPGSENRVNEISEISRSLKALAKELQVPVIALSQLSRAIEQRPDKRPMMSDLRESGAIEQDADMICFIYRDDYYNKETSERPGQADIIIGKQRNGPTGDCTLNFLGEYTKFENWAPEMYSSEEYPV